jgi:enolase
LRIVESRIRMVLDSRGSRTVEVEIGIGTAGRVSRRARALAPSGASTGSHEVQAFNADFGAGVELFRKKVARSLKGSDPAEQNSIDSSLREIDGTPRLERLGGNVATATSIAVCKAGAISQGLSAHQWIARQTRSRRGFPAPMGNVIGGGRHAIGGTDIQEFLAVSMSRKPGIDVFANAAVHDLVGKALKEKLPGASIGKGDEGAWNAPVGNMEALELLVAACDKVRSDSGVEVRPALDLAATEFYRDGGYQYKEGRRSPADQVEFVSALIEDFGLVSVEDPLQEEDFVGFHNLRKKVGESALVMGDDLFCTNPERLERGIKLEAGNAILIKVNQIGTLSDTYKAIDLARRAGYKHVVSHRSGDTTDEFIAHLAVGTGAWGLKTGAIGGERVAKLNELVRIEEGRPLI